MRPAGPWLGLPKRWSINCRWTRFQCSHWKLVAWPNRGRSHRRWAPSGHHRRQDRRVQSSRSTSNWDSVRVESTRRRDQLQLRRGRRWLRDARRRACGSNVDDPPAVPFRVDAKSVYPRQRRSQPKRHWRPHCLADGPHRQSGTQS